MNFELTKAQHADLVEMLAEKWATAKAFAMLPTMTRVWNWPQSGMTLKEKRDFVNRKAGEAAKLAGILHKLGATLPQIDVSRYLVDKRMDSISSAKPGDKQYVQQYRIEYCKEITKEILAQVTKA